MASHDQSEAHELSDHPHGEARDLFKAHHAALLDRALAICRRRHVAEEVCQEAWLAIFRALPKFEGRSSLRWWMLRIVSNRAYTRMRKESRFVLASDAEQPEIEPGLPGPTPESLAIGHQLVQRMEDAVSDLPARQRQVLEMRQLEGRTAEDVCQALEVSPVNQRVLLHRARRNLRRAMGAATPS